MGSVNSCDACRFEKYEKTSEGIESFCFLDKSVKTGSGNHDRMTEIHPDCPLRKNNLDKNNDC